MTQITPRRPKGTYDIGFEEACDLAMRHMPRTEPEPCSVVEAAGRICAADCLALVDAPSINASTKDGYAVISNDVTAASQSNPVALDIVSRVAAGSHSSAAVSPGNSARILTGAPLPPGADAVLADEFVNTDGLRIHARTDAPAGKNIIPRGTDLSTGDLLAKAGQTITPPLAGLVEGEMVVAEAEVRGERRRRRRVLAVPEQGQVGLEAVAVALAARGGGEVPELSRQLVQLLGPYARAQPVDARPVPVASLVQ